jgi:O-succinylbenzoate synthase
MLIERIELRHVRMRLKLPFQTSFGVQQERDCLIVSAHADGLTGWGECPAATVPSREIVAAGGAALYSYETTVTAWHVLADFLVPRVLGGPLSIERAEEAGAALRGHPMARAALESALWDVWAQAEGVSLAQALGGTRPAVPVGVSVGIHPTVAELAARVDAYLADGYRRVKIKIEPGYDIEPVALLRGHYPDLALQVDANSAYSLADAPLFQALDDYDLLLVEQPLGWDDLYEHAQLQAQVRTPVCLDESIHGLAATRAALALRAARVINIKVPRVGGLSEARRIHDLCQAWGVPVWCGGMLETGIGRAANLAIASLPGFSLPGDISASARYYEADLVDPPFTLNPDSTITVPTAPGLGVTVNQARLDAATLRREVFA